jgi:hypothetical protein
MGKTQVGAAFLTIMKYYWSAIVPATAAAARSAIKPLIVAANNSNGSTLNERYCLFTPFEMYLPQMVEDKAYSWHCAASASRIWLRPLSNATYTVTGSAWHRSRCRISSCCGSY